MINEQELKIKKECNPNEHHFKIIPKSALVPLDDGTLNFGLGFKTWECQNCKKKVKSS